MITGLEGKSDTHKNGVSELSKAIGQLDAFTHNLQSKVDGMLKAKQLQFVNSYKQHMLKVKQQVENLNRQLKTKDAQISSLENQGKMSNLIKRVAFLEVEQKKLLTDLEKKKKDIKQLHLQKEIQKSQIKRLQQKVKELMRSKTSMQQRMSKERNPTNQSMPTFATQVGQSMSKRKLQKIITHQKSIKLNDFSQRSQRSQASINPQNAYEYSRLQKQISHLRKQNRELISFNSKFVSGTSSMEHFFIDVVNEIKKNITVRKQVKQCSLEDFRKEDKLQLLIKILSNDELLFHLHSLIFTKKQNNSEKQQNNKIERPMSLRNKHILNRSSEYGFPSIKSARMG